MSIGGKEFTVAVRVSVLAHRSASAIWNGSKGQAFHIMSKLRILNAIGRAFRGQSAELTAAPLPARWRDIMNDIDLEEMLVDSRRSDSEHGSPRDLEIEITRALDRLKAS
jgi:hypothetical protein